MLLFINACPRHDSRTKVLADSVLRKEGAFKELNLYRTDLQPIDEAALSLRCRLSEEKKWDDDCFALARQFAAADKIVIAAPFWDYAFPSKLKIYLENIYVIGIVSRYREDGTPVGLCRAKELVYVTTAGGPFDGRFGYDYIKTLCQTCFGIPEVSLVKADMLDIAGNDASTILDSAVRRISSEA